MFKNLSTFYNEKLDTLAEDISNKQLGELNFRKLSNPKLTCKKMLFFLYNIEDNKHFQKIAKKKHLNDINHRLDFLTDTEMPNLNKLKRNMAKWLEQFYIHYLAESIRNDTDFLNAHNIDKNCSDEDLIYLISFTYQDFDKIPFDKFKHEHQLLNLFRNGNTKISEKMQSTTDYFRNLKSVYNNDVPINLLSQSCPNYFICENEKNINELVNQIKKHNLTIHHLKNESDFLELYYVFKNIENTLSSNQAISLKPNNDLEQTFTQKQEIFLLDFSNHSMLNILSENPNLRTSLLFAQYNRSYYKPIIINVNQETYEKMHNISLSDEKKLYGLKYFLYNAHSNIMKI